MTGPILVIGATGTVGSDFWCCQAGDLGSYRRDGVSVLRTFGELEVVMLRLGVASALPRVRRPSEEVGHG